MVSVEYGRMLLGGRREMRAMWGLIELTACLATIETVETFMGAIKLAGSPFKMNTPTLLGLLQMASGSLTALCFGAYGAQTEDK